MDRVNYDQTEGFPLDVNILDFGQKANQISQQLGEIIAPLAIVRGCVENGNQVTDGIVYLNGEILPFKGGSKQNLVRIVETTENRVFENGNSKPVLITRYVTFGAGANQSYNWTDFHRPMSIKEIQKRLMPVGCIVLDYYGRIEDIPSGYFLCDGSNGTPDLRGMFIVGYDPENADYNEIGKVGGLKEVKLTTNQMPKHTPTGSVSIPDHAHNYQLAVKGRGYEPKATDYPLSTTQNAQTSSAGGGTFNVSMNEVGGDQAHENRPPFYVLAKIMYKG
ncbi:hypothetical protein HX096_12620 [Empedobacter falsenii]|uniref:hypothetical protein n=1 Tax=Empedobacter falsenii TaxID=343874 RepID=UPI002577675E|nr:hypothetical protein [Empedobacter falsenii]MDM1548697.1 hypothetical protein [Empedobacter falsenii]